MTSQLYSKTRTISLITAGSSMLPLIQPQDTIHFIPTSPNHIKLNDIIVFRQKKRLIAHRLIYKADRYFVTQGDNLLNPDQPQPYFHLVGKVISLTRQGQTFPITYLYLQQSSLYLHQLNHLVKTFNQHKINYLFLKGLPLHLYYQKQPPQRLYLDCDLLIDPNQLNQVTNLLHQLNFKPYNPPTFFTPPFHQSLELSFSKSTSTFPVILDLHLAPLFLPKQLATPNHLFPQTLLHQYTHHLLKNKITVNLKNQSYPLISPSDSIIYLSLHFFHHNLQGIQRLQLLHQILLYLSPTSEDWIKVAQLANQFYLADFIYPSLKIFSHFFSYPIPKEFWSHLRIHHPTTVTKLAQTNPLRPSSSRFLNGFRLTLNSFLLSPQPPKEKLKIFLSPTNYLNFIFLFLHKLYHYPLVLYRKLKHLLWLD